MPPSTTDLQKQIVEIRELLTKGNNDIAPLYILSREVKEVREVQKIQEREDRKSRSQVLYGLVILIFTVIVKIIMQLDIKESFLNMWRN